MGEDQHIKDQLDQEKGYSEMDRTAYEHVFAGLAKQPEYTLPATLSEQVIERIVAKEKKERIWFVLLIILGSLGMIALGLGLIVYFYGTEGFLKYERLTGYAIIVGAILFMVQYLDSLILKKQRLSF